MGFGRSDFALVRYQSNGELDPSWSGDGKTRTDIAGHDDAANGVAIQLDGKPVAVGVGQRSSGNDFALARYKPNGAADPTFSGDGKTVTDFASGDDGGEGVALQPDGRIVVAGHAEDQAADDHFGVVRYKPNGAVDPAFAGDGKTMTDFASGDDGGEGVALQPDGKVVVAGFGPNGAGELNFAVTRYLGQP